MEELGRVGPETGGTPGAARMCLRPLAAGAVCRVPRF